MKKPLLFKVRLVYLTQLIADLPRITIREHYITDGIVCYFLFKKRNIFTPRSRSTSDTARAPFAHKGMRDTHDIFPKQAHFEIHTLQI